MVSIPSAPTDGGYGAEVDHRRRGSAEVADGVGLDLDAGRDRPGVVAGVDVVVAGAGDDRVAGAVEAAERVGAVVVQLAVDRVVVGATGDPVGAPAGADEVVAAEPGDRVVAVAGPDHVTLRRAGQGVGLGVADDRGLARRRSRRGRVGGRPQAMRAGSAREAVMVGRNAWDLRGDDVLWSVTTGGTPQTSPELSGAARAATPCRVSTSTSRPPAHRGVGPRACIPPRERHPTRPTRPRARAGRSG